VVRFADTQPTRRIRTRKGPRHLPGRWWSATDGGHIGYESWLERDQLMWLDWDGAVTGTASQPFRAAASWAAISSAEAADLGAELFSGVARCSAATAHASVANVALVGRGPYRF
jgi:hypothetical protein